MKILVIQTSFIGDVILSTPVLEKLHSVYPEARIDFLLKSGNESLFRNHPFLNTVLVFDKNKNKLSNLFSLMRIVRKNKYDLVLNLHRHSSSGIITARSGAREKIGFDKNPFSFMYTRKIKHHIGTDGTQHETGRNLETVAHLQGKADPRPKLYPTATDYEKVKRTHKYVCMAPASVWFTKQLPEEKWVELVQKIPAETEICLLGAKSDIALCERIKGKSGRSTITIEAGNLSFLESAALMKNAVMNFVNDSAPMHLASSVNAPITAFFCSTVPAFGFGPLSDQSFILETEELLDCRPCGLHGYKACPRGHFKCGYSIKVN